MGKGAATGVRISDFEALLATLLAVCLLLAVGPALAASKITAEEAYARLSSGELVLLDVRSPAEWRETGLPAGAKAVTIHNPRGMGAFLDEVLKAVDGDRERPVALICAGGVRSSRAQRYLMAHGFSNVFNVSEGMAGNVLAPGWLARGLPTEPCTAC